MFAFLKRERWAHLTTLTIDGVSYGSKKGHVYIHLQESDRGNRRSLNGSTFPDLPAKDLDTFVLSSEIYQTKVLRWLHGRYDPEIPRYSEVGQDDLANALVGKIT